MADKIINITDDLDYYATVYKTYVSLSEQSGSIEEWVHTSSFVDSVVGRLSNALTGVDALRVLGIGSGAGHNDCFMLKQILPSFPRICNTIVEPSVGQIDLFKQYVDEHREDLTGVTFDWIPQTSDDYLQSIEESSTPVKKFHLITTVHAIYYATDLKETIRRLHNLLEDGGILFIIIGSNDLTSIAVARRIHSIQKGLITSPHPIDKDVLSALDSLGLSYTHGQVTRYLKGSALFDESSEEGRHLLDFYTHIKDFRETAPEVVRDSVLELLGSQTCSKKRGDETFFHRHWVHITVPK